MFFSAREKIVLRKLSENSRSSLSSMAKLAGCSYVTIGKTVEKLKEKLDIKFVLELDLAKLGFLQRHILMIRFAKNPPSEWLESLFKNEAGVDAAFLTEGEFNVIVIAIASNPSRYVLWEFQLIQKLSSYGAEVRTSDLPYFSFGYIHTENAFLENALVKMKGNDRKLLQLLNENSRQSYSELAKKLKTSESTIRYKIFNLTKSGIVKRFTIAAQNPPQPYTIALFESWKLYTKRFEEKAALERKLTMSIDEKMPTLNTFQLSAPLSGSFGNFTIGLFETEKDAIENTIAKRKDIYRTENYEVMHARIVKSLKGLFPYRNLDVKENYDVVKWE